MGPRFEALHERVAPFSMTTPERLFAVHEAVRYLDAAGIEGDFVECGVWRGGSTMMAALTTLEQGPAARHLWLYDTFEGMTEPRDVDVAFDGTSASDEYVARTPEGWCDASVDDVSANMRSTGYPAELVHLVEGKVEQTIPASAPDRIALLRLDTDWYDSTRHELEHLWPRLVPGGVLIVDDYGHWAGARKAVDEFFADAPILLSRIDYTGRMAVKTA